MPLLNDELYPKLQEVFDSIFDEPVVIHPELTASDVDDWDSLTHVTLIIAVEKAFGVRFHAGEISGFKNVREMAARIIELVG